MDIQNLSKKLGLGGLMAVSMMIGAAGGTTLFNTVVAHAQSTTPQVVTAQSSTPSVDPNTNQNNGSGGSTFKSNEDPTHESKESAQWEAQENAGQAPWQHQSANGSQ